MILMPVSSPTEIVKALVESFSLALLVVIAVAPGEPLYRAGQPNHLRLGSAFTFAGLRTRQFFCAGVVGLCLAAVHIGYVVAFYVVGRRFGVWAPQDLQYSDTLSTALPWIYPPDHRHLRGGQRGVFVPHVLDSLSDARHAIGESWPSCCLPLPGAFCTRITRKSRPISAGSRSERSASLPGWVMLRWGILATLTWHYTVDAFLTSLSLMRSQDLYTRISGGLVGFAAVIPVAVAGILYLRRGSVRRRNGSAQSCAAVTRARCRRGRTALRRPSAALLISH